MRSKQAMAGFAALELLLIGVILVAIGFGGWWLYQRQHTATATKPTDSTNPSTATTTPPINTTSDLDTASQTLDQSSSSRSDTNDLNQLSSQLDSF